MANRTLPQEPNIQEHSREEWHRLMWDYEQDLLDAFIKVHKTQEKICADVPVDLVIPRPAYAYEYITVKYILT